MSSRPRKAPATSPSGMHLELVARRRLVVAKRHELQPYLVDHSVSVSSSGSSDSSRVSTSTLIDATLAVT